MDASMNFSEAAVHTPSDRTIFDREKDDKFEVQIDCCESTVSDHEIEWRYLTFSTDLPMPFYGSQSGHLFEAGQLPPNCPDLRKYASPFQWSAKRKMFILLTSCVTTLVSAGSAGAYEPAIDKMSRKWHVSTVALLVGITSYTCGFAISPMVLAPLSEINGRRPMFIATGWLFVAMNLTCALTPSYAGMIVARFFVGFFGSTFSTIVGGVVADMYRAEDRNTAMALFAGSSMFGIGLGPLVSGLVAQHVSWRWVFYLQAIMCGLVQTLVLLFFKETRGSVLLSRKAKALNKWYENLEQAGYYGVVPLFKWSHSADSEKTFPSAPEPVRIRWKVKSDEERASILTMFGISVRRPFFLLLHEPTIFLFSLWLSFSWAVLYLTFSAIPLIFSTRHDFTVEQSGAVFASICIASCISTTIAVHQENLARKILPPEYHSFLSAPEGHLCASCIQSLLLPIGLFWLGWTSFRSIHWIVPTIGIGCATMGVFSVYLATVQFFADVYGRYASSALAAQNFCRTMLAGAFPLFTDQMFRTMTYQGAASFLGGIALLLSVVPWVLVIFGPRIRARSRFAKESLEDEG